MLSMLEFMLEVEKLTYLAELFSRILLSPPRLTLRFGRSGALPLPTQTMSFLQTIILLVVVLVVLPVRASLQSFQLLKQLLIRSRVLLEVTIPVGWIQVMSSRVRCIERFPGGSVVLRLYKKLTSQLTIN